MVAYLYERVGTWHFKRTDLKFPEERRQAILDTMRSRSDIGGRSVVELNPLDGLHFSFADGSWLLCRLSGTEPLLRLYAETTTQEDAEALVAEARRLVGL